MLVRFIQDEHGQDLTEYTLIIALVSFLVFALMASTGTTAAGIWRTSNSALVTANASAS
jgi:Flp pilus assembly pilin Flp